MIAPLIPKLATLLATYFETAEFIEMAAVFGVRTEVSDDDSGRSQWFSVARQLLENPDLENTRLLLASLLEQFEARNATAIARTDWERRAAHETLRPIVKDLTTSLSQIGAPSEIVVPPGKRFSAKSKVREHLAEATTDILIVDPYIGLGTLDCLRLVGNPIRLLTAEAPTAIEGGFERALTEFKKEGLIIDVRRAPRLHDRHLVFNRRCWLVGSSLKDAGSKGFHCIEIHECAALIADLESKWVGGKPFP